MTGLAPWLDRDSEPWIGTFPRLGEVRVFSDGRYDVTVVDGAPATAAESLEQGWALPLSWVRQGLWVASASALVAPDGRGLLVNSDQANAARLIRSLMACGWTPVSVGLTALCPPPDVAVHPRPGPLLVRSAAAPKQPAVAWSRSQVKLEAPPLTEPVAIHAQVIVFERPGPTRLSRITAKQSLATSVADPWQAGEPRSRAEVMELGLAWSKIPLAHVMGSPDSFGDAVMSWWAGL